MAGISESVSNVSKLVRQAIGSALSSVHAGDEKIASHQKKQMGTKVLSLKSSSFLDNGDIPRINTPQGENISPDLAWTGVPTEARELVLIVEDPDAPMLNPFVHWILHGLPPTINSLPRGIPTIPKLPQLGNAVQGQNDAKSTGWFGPKPPLGHGIHHYHFQLFALDESLKLGPNATLKQITQAMQGHVLADGEIVGTYEMTVKSA